MGKKSRRQRRDKRPPDPVAPPHESAESVSAPAPAAPVPIFDVKASNPSSWADQAADAVAATRDIMSSSSWANQAAEAVAATRLQMGAVVADPAAQAKSGAQLPQGWGRNEISSTPPGMIVIQVPEGAAPGATLEYQLDDGRTLDVTVPEGARAGDRMQVPTDIADGMVPVSELVDMQRQMYSMQATIAALEVKAGQYGIISPPESEPGAAAEPKGLRKQSAPPADSKSLPPEIAAEVRSRIEENTRFIRQQDIDCDIAGIDLHSPFYPFAPPKLVWRNQFGDPGLSRSDFTEISAAWQDLIAMHAGDRVRAKYLNEYVSAFVIERTVKRGLDAGLRSLARWPRIEPYWHRLRRRICRGPHCLAHNSVTKLLEPRCFVCDGCGQARYCSEACQRADWLEHRQVCPAGVLSSGL